MSAGVRAVVRVLLYEPAADRLPADRAFEIIRSLLERGYAVRRGDALPGIVKGDPRPVVVLGRFPHGAPPAAEPLRFVDVGDAPAAELAQRVAQAARPENGEQSADGEKAANGEKAARWKPWFPVIDSSRCTNCMQCLSFCLFDVYGVTADARITVANPANCKTDCPACSRVCPEVAIVFPKYKAGPINGDEVSADDVRREAMKIDISALLGGDIYSLLRDRSQRAKSRFSKERDDDRALQERQRCLTKLQQELAELDVPAAALASLPSPDEIREKAETARRRAQEALAQQSQNAATPRTQE